MKADRCPWWLCRALLAVLGVSAVLSAIGCTLDLHIRSGVRPDLAVLDQRLSLGRSTPEDVLALLGPPQGTGQMLFPYDDKPRTMWSYEYSEGFYRNGEKTADLRMLQLLVLFDEDRYDGYIWFSSLREKQRPTPEPKERSPSKQQQ